MFALKDIFTGGVSRRSTTGKSPNGEAEASARAVGLTRAARGARCNTGNTPQTETKRTVKRLKPSGNGCSLETTKPTEQPLKGGCLCWNRQNAATALQRLRLGEPHTELPYGVAARRDALFTFNQQGAITMSNTLQNLLEAVLFCVFTVVFVWLYCLATPSQMSGEYDLAEQAGRSHYSCNALTNHSVPPRAVKAY